MRLADNDELVGIVLDHVFRGDIEGALDLIERYVHRFADVIPKVFQDVGEATAAELTQQIGGLAVAIGFDITDERAAAIARRARLRLISEFTDSQRRAVRQALTRGMLEGAGTQQMARWFRGSIGLTARQEQAVFNYGNLLRQQSAAALRRGHRNRRFDDRVRQAVFDQKPLTSKQIGTMVAAYRSRARKARADTIARTEALRITSEAREETLRQALDQTGLGPNEVERVWNSTDDHRTRDHHEKMDGQRAPVDGKFRDGLGNLLRWPGDPEAPAETTINCRCTVTFSIQSPS